MTTRQYKTLSFKAEDAEGLEENSFCGLAAAFSNVDSSGEIIEKGAFASTIDQYLKSGTVCWQHDWTEPIGKPVAVKETDAGLAITARISQTVQGKDALTLLRDGVIQKMSIGYTVKSSKVLSDEEGIARLGQDGYDAAKADLPWYSDGIKLLTGLKLYEVSLVTVPANADAIVTGVKNGALAGLTLDDHFQTVLATEREYLTRIKELADLRAKEGRTLSESHKAKLVEMNESLKSHEAVIEDLLDKSKPEGEDEAKSDPEQPDEAQAQADQKALLDAAMLHERIRFEQTEARLNGALPLT